MARVVRASWAELEHLNLEPEGVKTQHSRLCFIYKTQKRFALTLAAFQEIVWERMMRYS